MNKISFYKYLEEIRKRPKMYLLDDCSFSTLYGFIFGFGAGSNHDFQNGGNYNDFNYFSFWLMGHLPNQGPNSMGWYHLISQRNNSDEKCLEDFFNLLEIFKNDKTERKEFIIKPKIISYTRYDSEENSKYYEHTINKLERVKYEKSKTIWVNYIENDNNRQGRRSFQ